MLIPVIIVAFVGVLVGGLLNALADDLPHHRSPRLPHYPDDTPRPFSAWLGLSAFLTGQRSSPGGAKLSWRYPLTELLTAAMMVITVIVTYDDPAMTTLQLVFWLIYMAIFVLIVVIDIEHKLILFSVIIPAAILAIIDAALTEYTNYRPFLSDALLGGGIAFAVSLLFYAGGFLFIRISGRMRGHSVDEIAFGYGDVMLFTLSGLILGPEPLLFAFYITVITGAIGAVLFLLGRGLRRRGYSLFTALPYGPYIVLGTVLMLLFSDEVLRFMGFR
jgi:leader peptidase (prepilin peptidase) / N-methyltransferase